MSRTLRSTSVKSVKRRSSATAASRLFVACLSNWVKKKLFFGISDRRMGGVLLLGTGPWLGKATASVRLSHPAYAAAEMGIQPSRVTVWSMKPGRRSQRRSAEIVDGRRNFAGERE